jgi:putative molybdopterin biosynthesis protein
VDTLQRDQGVTVLASQRGSRASLGGLARGEAHVAGVHLLDPLTGAFNGPWVAKLVPFPCTIVRFATWEQGLLVAPGNPLGIDGVQDLVRSGVRFLNREVGSGSRSLLDQRVLAAGIRAESIPGYLDTRATGHMAVAEAVASGVADVGVGIRAAGLACGLGMIPLATERYDLVIPDHFLDLPAIQALLNGLSRPGIQAQVDALGGYDVSGMGH